MTAAHKKEGDSMSMSSRCSRIIVALVVPVLLVSLPIIGQEISGTEAGPSKYSPGDCRAGASLGATLLGPSWAPLLSNIKAYQENGSRVGQSDITTIAFATQKLPVSHLGLPTSFGWIEFNARANQAWVQTSLAAFGRFSASYNGTPLAFLCNVSPSTYPYR
jgi:hypothetical protein